MRDDATESLSDATPSRSSLAGGAVFCSPLEGKQRAIAEQALISSSTVAAFGG